MNPSLTSKPQTEANGVRSTDPSIRSQAFIPSRGSKPSSTLASAAPRKAAPAGRFQPSTTCRTSTSRPTAARPPTNRFQLSNTGFATSQRATVSKPAISRAQPTSKTGNGLRPGHRGVKRKSATPTADFSEDEDSGAESRDSDSDASVRKRAKSSISSVDTHAASKRNLAADAFSSPVKFIHGKVLTTGSHLYKPVWEAEDSTPLRATLQYPSDCSKEIFEMKELKHATKDEYKPMDDIEETIKTICHFYLPAKDKKAIKPIDIVLDRFDTTFARRFTRAKSEQDIDGYLDIIEDFNALLKPLVEDGSIRRELQTRGTLPLDWVERILTQVYQRTVSPRIESLRDYENGTDQVYGELLPRLVNGIIDRTQLAHDQVFVDLGSGVGNVVLQTALQVGCESWGIEYMPNPCALATLQATEFVARTKLWGLKTGTVNLLSGSFFDNIEIDEVLKRADVVLVNNQVFLSQTNDALMTKFLGLKEGCKVVSLKPFVPKDHCIKKENVESISGIFRSAEYQYFSDCVSWTAKGGTYYIATKDSSALIKFKQEHGLR